MAISKIAENSGMTLIELLMAMAIFAIVTAAGYNLYLSQRKANLIQEQMVEMHQNLRSAMFYLEDELKTAGCDPNNTDTAGFLQANTTSLQFTRDVTDYNNVTNTPGTGWFDGDVLDENENITYSCVDTDGDGNTELVRLEAWAGLNADGTIPIVASNIEVLNFVYLNGNGTVIPVPVAPGSLDSIRSVEITMVARSRQQDPDHIDTESFDNLQGTTIFTPPADDHYYRRALSVTVNCRNM